MFNQVNEYVDLLEYRVPLNHIKSVGLPSFSSTQFSKGTGWHWHSFSVLFCVEVTSSTRDQATPEETPGTSTGEWDSKSWSIRDYPHSTWETGAETDESSDKLRISAVFACQIGPQNLLTMEDGQQKTEIFEKSLYKYTVFKINLQNLSVSENGEYQGIAAIREKTLRWNVWKQHDYCNVVPPSYKMVYKPH